MLASAPSDTTTRSTLHFPAAVAAAASPDAAASADAAPSDGSGRADLSWPTLSPFVASDDWNYDGARVLAPMVRIGTLPMRLLAIEMGATMAYSEELVAKKLRNCTRVERMGKNGRVFVDFIPGRGGAAAASGVGAAATASAAAAAVPSLPVEPVSLNSAFVTSGANSGSGSTSSATPKPARVHVHNANVKNPPALTTFSGERLVVQIGAATAEEALAAAQVVCRDARAIDCNMGCESTRTRRGENETTDGR
jgi:tRNA-dihydrouridine synthase